MKRRTNRATKQTRKELHTLLSAIPPLSDISAVDSSTALAVLSDLDRGKSGITDDLKKVKKHVFASVLPKLEQLPADKDRVLLTIRELEGIIALATNAGAAHTALAISEALVVTADLEAGLSPNTAIPRTKPNVIEKPIEPGMT